MENFQKGQLVSTFKVIETDYLPDCAAMGYLFKDQITGFEVYYVDSVDKECVFAYSFATIPYDDSGVFHILEHTLLSGSEKYPVKDPFMEINRASCNTFLNAMTYPDRTLYPAASVHEKDFDNIFRVYTDAVFKPLLRKETFMQEGIRIVKDEKGNLSFDGVVYHEMEGALNNHESVVLHDFVHYLFDQGPYTFESGGDPKSICTLTYEQYLAAFKKYYNPQNGKLFLYGKDVRIDEKLEFLAKNYLKENTGEKIELVNKVVAWNKPRRVVTTSPSVDNKQTGSILLSWLTTLNIDPAEELTANVLVDLLLGNPTCPLYSAILASGLGADLSEESGIYSEFYQMPFAVGFSEIEESKADKVEAFLLKTLEDISNREFTSQEIEAVLSRKEFSLREVKTLTGLRLFLRSIKGWERGVNPSFYFNSSALVEDLRAKLASNPHYFQDWIKTNLLNNPHRLLLVVKPDSSYLDKEKQVIDKVLLERTNDYSPVEEQRFIEFEATPDKEEEYAKLPSLNISDLPHDILKYDKSVDRGINTLLLPYSGGIIYSHLFFDITDFSIEQLKYTILLSRVLTSCGTNKASKEEAQTALRLNFGNISFYVESGSTINGECKVYFVVSYSVLKEKLEDSLALLFDFLTNFKISVASIKDGLSDILSSFSEEVLSNGSYYMAMAAGRGLTKSLYLGEELMGATSWLWFETLKKANKQELKKELKELSKAIFAENRVSMQVASEKEELATAVSLSLKFKSSFATSNIFESEEIIIPTPMDTAFLSPTNVAFNAMVFPCSPWTSFAQCSEALFATVLQAKELWNVIRSKGGAYGASCQVDISERVFMLSSYRDPRVMGTKNDFLKVLKNAQITQADLDNAIITNVGGSLKPLSPAQRASVSMRQTLYGITYEDRAERREWELSMTLKDLEEARVKLIEFAKKAGFATLVPKELYKAEGLTFEKVELPF